jgi:hypothetical protein
MKGSEKRKATKLIRSQCQRLLQSTALKKLANKRKKRRRKEGGGMREEGGRG